MWANEVRGAWPKGLRDASHAMRDTGRRKTVLGAWCLVPGVSVRDTGFEARVAGVGDPGFGARVTGEKELARE